ncbi:hypothetical protein X975_14424, partial [Stegodyphus mimosarum]
MMKNLQQNFSKEKAINHVRKLCSNNHEIELCYSNNLAAYWGCRKETCKEKKGNSGADG